MPRKPRKTRTRKLSTIPAALLKYFEGESYNSDDEGACDTFLMELRPAMKEAWDSYRDQVLNNWIKRNPCSRPYAFWKFDAPELRKQISGSGDVDYEGACISSDGLPEYWQVEWDKNDLPTFESEAACLQRLGILTPTEKAYLKKHPKLMEPEVIEYEDE